MVADTTFRSRWDLIPDRFEADNTIVRLKRPDDCVVARFDPADWHKIFVDIDSDGQLNGFLAANLATVKAFILEDGRTGASFGWICLRRRDEVLCDTVEFHGGAWKAGFGASRGKFRAAIMVIGAAQRAGIRVVATAFRTNTPAIRFLEAIGFRSVRRPSRRPYIYLTLSRERLRKSAFARPGNFL